MYSGGSCEIRTRDQRIKSPLLYRLSYRPERVRNYSQAIGARQYFGAFFFAIDRIATINPGLRNPVADWRSDKLCVQESTSGWLETTDSRTHVR